MVYLSFQFKTHFECFILFFNPTEDCVDASGNPVSGEPFENPDDCTKFYQVIL